MTDPRRTTGPIVVAMIAIAFGAWDLVGVAALGTGAQLDGNAGFVAGAFSDDGSRFVAAEEVHYGARIRVFDARRGTLLSAIDASYLSGPGLIVSGDAKRVISSGNAALEVRGLDHGEVLGSVPLLPGSFRGIGGFAPEDGKVVIIDNECFVVWDFVHRRPLRETKYPRHGVTIMIPTQSPDGRRVAFADAPTVSTLVPYVFDSVRGSIIPVPYERRWVYGFLFSPDSRILAVGGDPDIELRELASGRTWHTAACPSERNQFLIPRRFSPDSRWLVAEGDRGQVCTFDVRDGHLIGSGNAPNRDDGDHVDVSADASTAVIHRRDDTFEIWDARNASRRTVLDGTGVVLPPRSLRWRLTRHYILSPDGSLLFISDRWGSGAWDTATGQRLFTLNDPQRNKGGSTSGGRPQ